MIDSELRTFVTVRRLLAKGWVLSQSDEKFMLSNPDVEGEVLPVREAEADAVLKLLTVDSEEQVGPKTITKYKLRDDIVLAEEENSALDGPHMDAANEDG